VSADHNDSDDSLMQAAFERNRGQMEGRFPAASGWAAPVCRKRVETAIAAAAGQGVALDFSPASAAGLERLIASWELEARVALDLDDQAWVADDVAAVLDIPALGAYYGELFVRHAGAAWTKAEGEDGPEPVVARGGVTVLPITLVRRRVHGGPPPDLAERFATESAAMESWGEG
jgi:hypothetical protein